MNRTIQFVLKYYKVALVAFIVVLFWGAVLMLLRKDVGGKTIHILITMIVAFYSFRDLKTNSFSYYPAGILLGLAVLLLFTVINHTVHAIFSDSQFDFMCFYMQGQLGIHNMPFYDPDSFKILLETIHYPFVFEKQIRVEILNVGLLSPPVTMLFFAPLASFEYTTSRTVFSILVFVFIIANAILANIVFLKSDRSFFSFLFIFIVIVLIPATSSTIEYVQTNFFLLFFLLLALLTIDKPVSGIYLALSTIIKPLSGILFLFYLINTRWKSALYFCATMAFLVIVTSVFWGVDNILNFFISPPTNRLPITLYGDEEINQSLLAILNRNLSNYGFDFKTIKVVYFIFSLLLIVITGFASRKVEKSNPRFAFLIYFPVMLMIYPSSLSYYSVYLLPVLFYFLLLQNGEKFLWIMILPAFGFINSESFYSSLVIWLIMIYISAIYSAKGSFFTHLPGNKMLVAEEVKTE